MAVVVPSLEMSVSTGAIAIALFTLVIIAFLFFGVRFLRFAPNSSVSDSTSSFISQSSDSPIMQPFVIPTSFEAQSLLDLSPGEFEFPSLQPHMVPTRPASFAPNPIIREVDEHKWPRDRRPRGRPRRARSKRLIGFQGSPIDLVEDVSNHDTTPKRVVQRNWLRWAVGNASIFASREEELCAARLPGNNFDRNNLKDNMFFQWGLRYVPPPGADNVYRAVVIEQLPMHTTLDRILPRIRGGQIYSASLFDTVPLTGFPSALITFVYQEGALAFLRQVAREGFYVGFRAVDVRPIPTPTYLLSATMEKEIIQHGRTRCLSVRSRRHLDKKSLHRVLMKSPFHQHVECFGEKDVNGVTTIRFHSIKMAMRAYDFLSYHDSFKGVIKFDTDPCALV